MLDGLVVFADVVAEMGGYGRIAKHRGGGAGA